MNLWQRLIKLEKEDAGAPSLVHHEGRTVDKILDLTCEQPTAFDIVVRL